jgi:endo-1,4-beta-xylanase
MQAFRYRDFFQAFRYLSDKLSSVTFWGQADDHTFKTTGGRVDAPLLFDIALLHKPAYTAIVDPSQLPGSGSTATFWGISRVDNPGRGVLPLEVAKFSLKNDEPSGTLSFSYAERRGLRLFRSTSIITYYLSSSDAGTEVDFTVVGEVNRRPGYILTGRAVDGGPCGSGLDTVSITLRTPTGQVIHESSAHVLWGDVVVTP